MTEEVASVPVIEARTEWTTEVQRYPDGCRGYVGVTDRARIRWKVVFTVVSLSATCET